MNESPFTLEEEIDLRQYLATLLQYWYWPVGLALISALTIFIVGVFTPPTYQATALVGITSPSMSDIQFDPHFQYIQAPNVNIVINQQAWAFSRLATGDDVLQEVAEKSGWELNNLREISDVSYDTSSLLLILKLTGQNGEEVMNTVNTWAEVFVKKANDGYGNENDLAQYQQRQMIAAQSLAEADAALTNFRKENGFGGSSLTEQRFQAKINLLVDYENELVHLKQEPQDSTSQNRISTIKAEMETLQKEIDVLQTELATQLAELEQLVRNRDIRAETYATISQQVQEIEIAIAGSDTLGKVKIVSQATAPEKIGSNQLRNSVMAGLVGLILGIMVVFAWRWWQERDPID